MQCRSWGGPISAALYVALHRPHNASRVMPSRGLGGRHHHLGIESDPELVAAIAKARAFHDMAENNLTCQLDLMLVYERFESEKATMLYPVNILRNYARLQVICCQRFRPIWVLLLPVQWNDMP